MKAALALFIAVVTGLPTANAAPAQPPDAPRTETHITSEVLQSDIDWDALAIQWQRDAAKAWPRLWDGALSPLVVILTDQSNNARLITKEETHAISVRDLIEHPLPLPGDGLSYGHWDANPAVVIDPTVPRPDIDSLFDLVVHEAFHMHVQFNPNYRWPAVMKPRLEVSFKYPMQVDPRLYRRMLHSSLLDAYVDVGNRPEHLAAAAWWQNVWATNFPEELARTNSRDVLEGTAMYAGILGEAMSKIDNPDSLQERRAYFANSLKPLAGCRQTGDEHYDIGGVAGLLLDDMRVDWMKRAEAGETPVEIVLDGIASSSGEQAPEHIRGTIAACVEKLASEAAPLVNKSLANMRDPLSPILELPYGLGGAGNHFKVVTDTYRADGIAYSFFGIRDGVFATRAGTVAATQTALFSGADGFLFSLGPADFDVVGRQLTLHGASLSGSLIVDTVHDSDGRVRYRAAGTHQAR